ncbi:hypothetical protein SAMN06269185_1062 [Natronoarchaeum philippinense]|uniref:Uncharacterized protein n=1 Tax=Natronoarchaeum philippinense TaxID=558529 RepID=A0A285NB33_NATPI|nr:hypothetical protein [Natronoarchaeum philippinense]SNZ06137.1 hypothetical protein SAMN06269185_1062 [Natronoarchaeum philippinense]
MGAGSAETDRRDSATASTARKTGSIDDLVADPKVRQLQHSSSASYRTSVSESHIDHIGIDGGDPIQMLLHPGHKPILIDEECIVIRPHPEAPSDD